MIDPEHAMPISHQAELLDISRSSFYYQPKPIPPADLALMLQILGGHPKAATRGHLRTGQRSVATFKTGQ